MSTCISNKLSDFGCSLGDFSSFRVFLGFVCIMGVTFRVKLCIFLCSFAISVLSIALGFFMTRFVAPCTSDQ